MYLFINISYETLSFKFNTQAIPVEIGTTIKPKPVIYNVTEPEVIAIKTKVSATFSIVDSASTSLTFFFD